MNNQGGQPERGAIFNFRDPEHLKPVIINPTTVIAELFHDGHGDLGAPRLSKAEILDIALHRAKKAA
ncbi:hypothetical protein HYU96_00335 [Candidatus Daviesbacteria bacterium]|nr:hypothetical protein [Candidatus Daviesbacteria bacterium]